MFTSVFYPPQFLCGPFLSLLSSLKYLALQYLTSVCDFPSSLNFQNTIFSLCVLNTLVILFRLLFLCLVLKYICSFGLHPQFSFTPMFLVDVIYHLSSTLTYKWTILTLLDTILIGLPTELSSWICPRDLKNSM